MTDTTDTSTDAATEQLPRTRKHIGTDWVGVGGHTVRCKCGEWAMTGGRLSDLKREHRKHRREQGEYAAPERPSMIDELRELPRLRQELEAAQELIEELLGEHVDKAAYQAYKNREAHLQALLEASRQELGEVSVALTDQRYYGEMLQMSIDSCSGNHEDIMETTHREKIGDQ